MPIYCMKELDKILVIQTAFIGDAILASSVLETLKRDFPHAELHFLVRKGNESLYQRHPYLKKIWTWDKKNGKYKNLFKTISLIRKERFDAVINLQRFAASGLMTAFSKAKYTIGFKKNPLSRFFSNSIEHHWGKKGDTEYLHEIDRNHQLLIDITTGDTCKPKLYPHLKHKKKIQPFQSKPYICIAPSSVWYTKQYPVEQWAKLINALDFEGRVYLLGAPSDVKICSSLLEKVNNDKEVVSLTGQLNLLESAALMEDAIINYVNDSAPMHLASSVNARTCAIYCSTIPEFGFGPLSSFSRIIQIEELECRPCTDHGKKACPLKHYHCGNNIETDQLVAAFEAAQEENTLQKDDMN